MKRLILLTGPTAAGKTAMAMMLADHFPVRLINVDSQQVYRGMDIGTAKLDSDALRQYPHALIDIRDPEDTYSVSDFVADATVVIDEAQQQGLYPVLVGGTPLYLRAMLYGLDDLPPANEELRQSLQEEAERVGWPRLHQRLASIDSRMARKIRPSDAQRIQRALEIHAQTERPPSELLSNNRLPLYDTLRLVITPGKREMLHQRIDQRFSGMLKQGFLEEVATLMARPHLTADHGAMKSVGYRQAWAFLERRSHDTAQLIAEVNAATRQLAKRQLTALRKLSNALWYDSECGQAPEQIRHSVVQWMEKQEGASGAPPG